MSSLIDWGLFFAPIGIAGCVLAYPFIRYVLGVRLPIICSAGLHREEHLKDVKHVENALIDSHYACVKCGREHVRVYNMWGKVVREYYIEKTKEQS